MELYCLHALLGGGRCEKGAKSNGYTCCSPAAGGKIAARANCLPTCNPKVG